MSNIPNGATFYYQHTYYQFGECYARYYNVKKRLWMDSAMFTNWHIELYGIKINR
jgi:hypothetical protein